MSDSAGSAGPPATRRRRIAYVLPVYNEQDNIATFQAALSEASASRTAWGRALETRRPAVMGQGMPGGVSESLELLGVVVCLGIVWWRRSLLLGIHAAVVQVALQRALGFR